jgi:bifunctional non-homologous end joining protein LigD
VTVTVGDREIQLSNLDKRLFPSGFTKGDMLDYYARIAPVMLPHLKDRPVTVKRFPNGIDQKGFIEKNAPRHAPDWIRTMTLPRKGTDRWGKPLEQDSDRETTEFVLVDELATMMFLVNLAAVEFHTPMWSAGPNNQPRSADLLVFDLDPGPPAGDHRVLSGRLCACGPAAADDRGGAGGQDERVQRPPALCPRHRQGLAG